MCSLRTQSPIERTSSRSRDGAQRLGCVQLFGQRLGEFAIAARHQLAQRAHEAHANRFTLAHHQNGLEPDRRVPTAQGRGKHIGGAGSVTRKREHEA